MDILDLSCIQQPDFESSLRHISFEGVRKLFISQQFCTILSVLCEIDFKNIQYLQLPHNRIQNLVPFLGLKLKKCKKISLSYNCISDLSPLSKADLIQIEYLDLTANYIFDLVPLGNLKNIKKINCNDNYLSSLVGYLLRLNAVTQTEIIFLRNQFFKQIKIQLKRLTRKNYCGKVIILDV